MPGGGFPWAFFLRTGSVPDYEEREKMTGFTEEMKRTYSVCPVCLKRIPAVREQREDGIYLIKSCPEHGDFSTVIWRNKTDFGTWRGIRPFVGESENLNCPTGCGLCADHLRATCCTLLEITKRCNMNCTFCFAEPNGAKDPSAGTVKAWIDDLVVPGKTLLQLSGGEPTVRDDLPEIIAYAKQAGCKYVQLNSNGLRLAEDEAFVKKLSEAGLSFVFMQFDGVTDEVYEKLRRRPMLEVKKKAIENCGRYGIGVTLVPVIVPGVNTDQIGDMIRFAVERSPKVRGVHFQPVSYFGRIPELPKDEDRFTLDELMAAVVEQTGGLVQMENIAPSCCDHPMCGFHGDFIVMPGRKLYALTHYKGTEPAAVSGCCCGTEAEDKVTPAEKNREFVGRRWERRAEEPEAVSGCCCGEAGAEPNCCCEETEPERNCCCGAAEPESGCCCGEAELEEPCCCGEAEPEEEVDMTDMESFLRRARSHGFTITSMTFQDAGNLDIERLRQCSLHVYKDGKIIPFCAYYLSPMGQQK